MDRKWFAVNHTFNIDNAEDLFALINFLIDSNRAEFEDTEVKDLSLARNMLENIGVRCESKTS